MIDLLTWIAPTATILAALVTASNLGSRVTGYGFIVFTVGSIAWLGMALLKGDAPLMWQNVALTLLNLFGIWRWLGHEARIEEGGRAAQQESRDTPGEPLFPASMLGQGRLVADDGSQLGRAVDAMIGCSSGRVSYLVAADGGVAGIGETLRQVSWSRLSARESEFRAQMSPGQFQALPVLDKDDWPG